MEIKDLAGISEPLKRLIEVVAEGIGGVSKPILTRKNADAKAYEIKTIAGAITESQQSLGPVKYETEAITIDSTLNGLPEAPFEKRLTSRLSYLESKRQANTERITQYASAEFDGTEDIGEEKPDSDWTSRFFRIAEDITTEEMQVLWGKVLSGEIKRPGSYSLRTLEILKNMTKKEAEVFIKTSKAVVTKGDRVFIPKTDRENFLSDHYGVSFLDRVLLEEIGLLSPTDAAYTIGQADEDDHDIFECGSTLIMLTRPEGTPKQKISVKLFTETGKQLKKLLDLSPADPEYIEKFAALYQIPGVVVSAAEMVTSADGETSHENLRDVPGNKPKEEVTQPEA